MLGLGFGLANLAAATATMGAPPAPAGPAGPYIDANFKTGTYATEAGASSFAALFEANADYSSETFASVTPGVGLVAASTDDGQIAFHAALKAAAAAAFQAGCVMVATCLVTVENAGTSIGFVAASLGDAPDYTAAWNWDFTQQDGSGAAEAEGTLLDQDAIFDNVPATFALDGVIKIAVRLAADALAMSVNGEPVRTTAAPQALAVATQVLGLSFNATGTGANAQMIVERVEIYTADEYTAGELQVLSA